MHEGFPSGSLALRGREEASFLFHECLYASDEVAPSAIFANECANFALSGKTP